MPGRGKGRFYDGAQRAELIARLMVGEMAHSIAKDTGIQKMAIANLKAYLRYRGKLPPASKVDHRELSSKVSRVQQSEIVRRLNEGEGAKDLALEFGLSPVTVYDYRRREAIRTTLGKNTGSTRVECHYVPDPARCVNAPQHAMEGSSMRPFTPQELMVGRAPVRRRSIGYLPGVSAEVD